MDHTTKTLNNNLQFNLHLDDDQKASHADYMESSSEVALQNTSTLVVCECGGMGGIGEENGRLLVL
jgi:hypothetical protein